MNYVEVIASDVKAQLPADARPNDDADALYRLYALLVLIRGESTTLEDVHNAWSTWMTARRPDHPALLPFARLEVEQQEQDRPYMDAIHRVALSRLDFLG